MSARLNNETYETVQRLMDDPSYMRRAQQVKEKYGDDYTQIYADLIDAYNNSPELLPKAKRTAFEDNARARMATTTESTKRHMDGGEFPKMGEYEYQYDINGVPYGTTIHEMNHNADYLKNKAADADANSNLYYWMRSALKPFSRIDPNTDKLTKYYSKPTEQKAYMNQLREFMYANKMIDTRDQIVTPDLIKQAISKLPKGMQSIKKASEQFKSMRSYTKWFNTYHYLEQERQEQINILQAMKTETDRKLYTYVTGVNTLDKYKEEHSYHYLPDVIMPPSQDSYNIEDILSEDQINAIKLFEDKKYFTQEEAHEVIEFLIRRCYELGATKNY